MMTLDLADTIVPKSDQLNADDLRSGPRTFTVAEVRKSGTEEQPVSVVLEEFPRGRPWKPSKSMRRVLVEAWGRDASTYAGKRLTLYRDEHIRFGGQEVGGIRIAAMSGIEKPKRMALHVTRGKYESIIIQPLSDAAPTDPVVSADLLAELVAMFERKGIAEDRRLAGVNHITGGSATALETITDTEAREVLAALNARPDVAASTPQSSGPDGPPVVADTAAPPASGPEQPTVSDRFDALGMRTKAEQNAYAALVLDREVADWRKLDRADWERVEEGLIADMEAQS